LQKWPAQVTNVSGSQPCTPRPPGFRPLLDFVVTVISISQDYEGLEPRFSSAESCISKLLQPQYMIDTIARKTY